MTRRQRAVWIVLLLAVVSTTPSVFGEQPWSGERADTREALAASIPRRELELALRQREEVLAEVKQRIREMGLKASAEELTDLLERRAHLEIDRDKCSLNLLKASECRAVRADLARVERSFQRETGLSTREFRSGRRQAPEPDRNGLRPQSKSQTCTCTFSVYSVHRWMNRYWALECNEHASHGVCSNNVDAVHSPGTGAMTGDIDLYFSGGAYHTHKSCPDDGTTCFHGPSTAHAGQWGNVCSCDTWHSQYYNPTGDWYGGDLTDDLRVHQLSTPYVTVAGSCNGNYVSVKEYIQENDPWCCDDPMGDLWFTAWVADGSGVSTAQASLQNCNGGSQSGVYPYCGTFGATLEVAYICQTYGDPPPPPPTCDPAAEQSCYDSGGNWDPNYCSCQTPCYHDGSCAEWDDVNCVCLRN